MKIICLINLYFMFFIKKYNFSTYYAQSIFFLPQI